MALYDAWDTGYTDYVTRMMRKKALGRYRQSLPFGGVLEDANQIALEFIRDPEATSEALNVVNDMDRMLRDFSGVYDFVKGNILAIRKININYSNFIMSKLNAIQTKHESALKIWIDALDKRYVEDMISAKNNFDKVLRELKSYSNEIQAKANLTPEQIKALMPDEGMFSGAEKLVKYAIVGGVVLVVLPTILSFIKRKDK